MTEHVEFIESYIKNGTGDYKWNGNNGELVRCKDCKHLGYTNSHWFCKWLNRCVDDDWFCADAVRKKDQLSSMYGIREE